MSKSPMYGISVLILLFFSTSLCGVMTSLNVEQLTKGASVVIAGRVQDVESHWNEDETEIITLATVVVEEVLKGSLRGSSVSVEYVGGEVGGLRLAVSDQVSLRAGEEVALFLNKGTKKAERDVYRVIGRAQGKYGIDEEGTARREGFKVLKDDESRDDVMPLSALKERIRNAK
jgi:hypothetical protein